MILTPWKEFQMPLTIRLLSTLLVAALSLATPLSSDAKCEAPGAIWASGFELREFPDRTFVCKSYRNQRLVNIKVETSTSTM